MKKFLILLLALLMCLSVFVSCFGDEKGENTTETVESNENGTTATTNEQKPLDTHSDDYVADKFPARS